MALKVLGLTSPKLSRGKPNLGYTDPETVMLDFDKTQFKTVRFWALKTVKWFKLGGFIVLKSSKNCYHVVFDRTVSWAENISVVAWVCLRYQNWDMTKWFLLQCIKKEPTLRVSPKKNKPSPRIVFRYGSQNGQIKSFLAYSVMSKRIVAKLASR
jgi:hypothetical protein